MQARRRTPSRRAAQRGAVALMFGLSLLALIGFAGLVLDGGRLYVNKTELQNAADACALAAANELPNAGLVLADFDRATAIGKFVARRNRIDFQRQELDLGSELVKGDVTVEFGTAANTAVWYGAGAAPADAVVARCTVQPANLQPWFMQVKDGVPLSARAAATRPAGGGNNCALPAGACDQAASLVM